MRDLLVISIVLIGCAIALRRPWIGVMLWTWLSLMSPHRYAWDLAYDAPLAAMTAASTVIGLVLTRDRQSPVKGTAAVLLIVFMMWITLSWLLGIDPEGDYEQWKKVMKIDVMIIVALTLLHTKKHIFALAWVAAGSLALIGAKGGLFTLTTGGAFHVWGPAGSFIEDNNAFALALVMTIPLLRFLQLQLTSVKGKHAMTAIMLLLAASALGSHSRGGLLAIAGMSLFLWWRGRSRIVGGVVIVIAAVLLTSFMPDNWSDRMWSIQAYGQDASAQGRFSAWWLAWNSAFQYPFGVGFNASRPELFLQYSPYGLTHGTPAAHSIYFQVLGHHGFVGLALFLLVWLATWMTAVHIRRSVASIPQARWCADLASMCQVSLVGYAVGGAFLSLAYFDLPYNVIVLVVLTAAWVRHKGWETEPVYQPSWDAIPGLATSPQPALSGTELPPSIASQPRLPQVG